MSLRWAHNRFVGFVMSRLNLRSFKHEFTAHNRAHEKKTPHEKKTQKKKLSAIVGRTGCTKLHSNYGLTQSQFHEIS